MKKCLRFIWILSLLVVICSNAYASLRYKVTDLNALTEISFVTGVNNQGMVIGYMSGNQPEAYAWQAGTGLIDLGPGQAIAVSDSGHVVIHPNVFIAILWESGNTTAIPTLGGRCTSARDVNNSGQVVGQSDNTSNNSRAFLWEAGLRIRDLGTLGGLYSIAMAINNCGQVVGNASTLSPGGRHAFLWQKETGMIDLVPIGRWSSALDINDSGQVVGQFETVSGDYHAFLWDKNAVPHILNLGTLGGGNSYAWGINNYGQVVGQAGTTNNQRRAFIWKADTGMVDLNNLIDPTLGWFLYDARHVYDDGSILAYGYRNSNECSCLLLTPNVIQVQIDIKPGDSANNISLKSKGNTPVAILGSADFDPSTVDPATVTLAGAPIALKGKGRYMTSLADINGDGLQDLVMHIVTQQMNLKPGDTKATLEGETLDGTPITGEDYVIVK